MIFYIFTTTLFTKFFCHNTSKCVTENWKEFCNKMWHGYIISIKKIMIKDMTLL